MLDISFQCYEEVNKREDPTTEKYKNELNDYELDFHLRKHKAGLEKERETEKKMRQHQLPTIRIILSIY